MMKRFTNRLALAPAIVLATTAFGQSATPQRVELPMQLSPAVLDSVPVGALPSGQRLHISVSIPPRDYPALRQFADDVSNPKHPLFRQYLTPRQVGERFGQTSPKVEAISEYFRAKGFQIELVADNRFSILASATVGQIENAFDISMVRRQSLRPKNMGELFVCYSGIPKLPKNIAPYVIDVGGLDGSIRPKPMTVLNPGMTRTLYNTAPLYDNAFRGQGRNIGISNWDGFRLTNVTKFYTDAGLPTPPGGVTKNIVRVPIAGRNGTTAPTVGEGDIDIQMALAIAPLCKLRIYDNAPEPGDPYDLIAVLTRESNDNICEIITESWGWSLPAGTATSAHNIHLAMTTQGITYMCASGDDGTDTLIGQPFTYPTYDGEVLMVGGTIATTNGSGIRQTEVGWSGSGGGWTTNTATFNTLPAYQVGTGIPTDIDHRLSPDVAFHSPLGDPWAYLFIYGGNLSLCGGTSAASPMFAGSLSLVLQRLIANQALPTTGRLGRLQDVIYALNGDTDIFFDVTQGSNGTLPNGNPSDAGVGWDFVTGWGAIDFDAFATALSPIFIRTTSITPGPIVGGGAIKPNFYVTLLTKAPAAGVTVQLSSSNPSLASVPATMRIAASGVTSRVVVAHHSVATPTTVTLSARVGNDIHTSELTLTPPTPVSVTITPVKVVGGAVATGKLTINVAAPTGGLVVPLASTNSAVASVPATITVPAGLKTVNLPVTSHAVATNQTATIQATYAGVTVTSKPITVVPPTFLSTAFNPLSVIGGSTSTVVLSATLTGPAPAGGVTLAIGTPTQPTVISVPSTLFIPEGQTTASVPVTHNTVTTGVNVSVPVTYGVLRRATLKVNPFPGVSSLKLTPTVVVGGSGTVVNGVVKITLKAPPEGILVLLESNDASATVPASVTVLDGQDTASFTVTHSAVVAKKTATIKAIRGATARTAALTIKP